ncbi:hypothetical protein MNBD_IGNAVI01-2530 [hydrothermal vent metagenome]|uniref:MaoC-like domain-containing protein n=1 Tax=hydrothermal vent metagenome TaxID=652676 RepID=A0A3B1CI85_9ZZZZ
MKISSKYVGYSLKEYSTVVSWRDTMNYAAAVNDNNPRYFNDEQESGIVAPPMYSVAVTWAVLERLSEYIDADDFPVEVLRTQVHHSEYLQFHNPIKPGDKLQINGVISAVFPGRTGTHIVIRFDAVNQDQKPIFTEYIGGLMRGVTCVDAGAGEKTLPQIPPSPKVEVPVWQQTIKIDPLLPYIYDGCTNIVFPIHTSQKFAHEVGLPGIILQGTAALAFAARELLDLYGEGNPVALQALACRFTGMIQPDTEIKIQLLSSKDNGEFTDLFFNVLGDQEQIVIKSGYARIKKNRNYIIN